jgi:hypothetical protein
MRFVCGVPVVVVIVLLQCATRSGALRAPEEPAEARTILPAGVALSEGVLDALTFSAQEPG